MDKYVGQTIEIIYLSKGRELTQRRVEVISVAPFQRTGVYTEW